jgi:hypothetical protein
LLGDVQRRSEIFSDSGARDAVGKLGGLGACETLDGDLVCGCQEDVAACCNEVTLAGEESGGVRDKEVGCPEGGRGVEGDAMLVLEGGSQASVEDLN